MVGRDETSVLTTCSNFISSSDLSLTERVIIMSTYEELQIILTTALLIVAILSYANKR